MSKEQWFEDVKTQWQVLHDWDFNEEKGDQMMYEFADDILDMYEEGMQPENAALEILTLDDPDWEDRLECGYDDEEFEERFGWRHDD